MPTLAVSVSASKHDAYQIGAGGTVYTSASYVEISRDTKTRRHGGFYFEGFDPIEGQTINSATLRIYARYSSDESTGIQFHTEDTDGAVEFDSGDGPADRALSSAYDSVTLPATGSGSYIDLDVTDCVSYYAANHTGGKIAIISQSPATCVGTWQATSYDHDPAKAATLTVDYSSSAPRRVPGVRSRPQRLQSKPRSRSWLPLAEQAAPTDARPPLLISQRARHIVPPPRSRVLLSGLRSTGSTPPTAYTIVSTPAGSDDAESVRNSVGSVSISVSNSQLTTYTLLATAWAGFRFSGLSGLRGGTISSATLTLTAATTTSGSVDVRVRAEDSGTPAQFTTVPTAPHNRTLLSEEASTSYPLGFNFADSVVVDVTGVMQQLLAAYSSTIEAACLIVRNANGNIARYAAHEHATYPPAELRIEYAPSENAWPLPPIVGRGGVPRHKPRSGVLSRALFATGEEPPPFNPALISAKAFARNPRHTARSSVVLGIDHSGEEPPPFLPPLVGPVAAFAKAPRHKASSSVVATFPNINLRPPEQITARGHRVEHAVHSRVCLPVLCDWQRRTATHVATGRIANATAYRFYRSNSAPPAEGDSPFATSSSLPSTPATAWADGTWYVSCSYFNGYVDSGFLALDTTGRTYRTLTLSGGTASSALPLDPAEVTLSVRSGGVVRVIATYAESGANAADTWCLAYTTDGSTPASGSPSVTATISALWVYDLPSQSNGTTVKVRVQVRRGSVYSSGYAVQTATADATGPSVPGGVVGS